MKKCYTCKEVKPLDDYTKSTTNKDGLRGSCKPCRTNYTKEYFKRNVDSQRRHSRTSNLKKFGVDAQWYYDTLDKQGGCCDICGDTMNTTRITKRTPNPRFAVDHDHKTGKLRGLLCCRCNRTLGLFKDNQSSIEKAIKYLERHNSK